MPEQYKMVLTGGIFFVVILCILFVYFKNVKKKKINYLLVLILLSLIPLISMVRPGSYESGDLSLHIMRTYSFYTILFDEHLLPRWTPEFNVGYGDPHFLLAYFLPYFIGSIFHFIGFSFVDSIKLLLALSYVLSGVTMYYWAKSELGEKAGFVSALFYLFVPYHLIDLHFRVTIAETLSFVFLPLLFLLAKKIIIKPTLVTLLAGAIAYALLILTHQIISLLFTPILCAYGLFLWFTRKKNTLLTLIYFFIMLGIGTFLSAFYWLPIIAESGYTQASLSRSVSSFTPLHELLYSQWRFGFLFQGHYGELGLIIGYTQLFVIAASVYLLIKNRVEKTKKYSLIFFLVLFFILIFLITPYSAILWETVPLIKYTQYSYRLLEFVAICTSIIAGIIVTVWNKNSFIVMLCFITVAYTILNWGNRRAVAEFNDTYLINQFKKKPDVGMYLEPSSPIWAHLTKSNLRVKPKAHIEILSGDAQIKEITRSSVRHTYVINAITDVKIKENTLFFPGWTLFVNDKPHTISYTNPQQPGVIHFSLNKGLYSVELVFRDTFYRTISAIISLMTVFLICIVLLFKFLRFKKTKR